MSTNVFTGYSTRRGSALEGYECPVDLGYCDEPNDIVHGPPVPIEEEPVPDPDSHRLRTSIVRDSFQRIQFSAWARNLGSQLQKKAFRQFADGKTRAIAHAMR